MEHKVLTLQDDALFSAQHTILWHSHCEMQVLFRLDFFQTAIIRKEEIIQQLFEKGELPSDVSPIRSFPLIIFNRVSIIVADVAVPLLYLVFPNYF